jgi:transaldolase
MDLLNLGVFPQRLLWASTGTKDPAASDVLYVENLVVPYTVNTMPENTLLAFADHGKSNVSAYNNPLLEESLIQEVEKYSINYADLASQLQKEGTESFIKSWNNLIQSVSQKRKSIK